MRRAVMLTGLVVVAVLSLLWLSGGLNGAAQLVQAAQHSAQDRLAGAIRALRAGKPGALMAFWGLCLGYGVLHAAGPGHGKLVIGGYGLARRVPVLRLAWLALAASLAQAVVAIALVYAALGLLGLTRASAEDAASRWMTPVGHAMVAGLGLWLVWRGIRGLGGPATVTVKAADGARDGHGHGDGHGDGHADGHDHAHNDAHDHDHAHAHTHDHDHDHVHGPGCNHAHGPTLAEVEALGGWRDAAVLVGGIALRPCTGALFILIITFQLGIALAGVVGALVMGLGTATITVAAALLAVWAREGAFSGLGLSRFAAAVPVVEIAVGAVIALAAAGLLIASL